MTRRDKLYDDYENALFALLMEDVAEAQGRQALAENQRLQADPAAAMPEALHERCVRTVRRKLAAGRRSAAGKTAFRLVSRVAVVVMLLVLTMTVAFAASPEVRTAVTRWAIKYYADRTEYSIPDSERSNSTGQKLIDEDGVWIGTKLKLSVGYIPEEMELIDEGTDNNAKWQLYRGPGKLVSVEIKYLGKQILALDTENASTSIVTIHGRAGVVNSSQYYCNILVPLTEYEGFLLIDCDGVLEDEVLKIADSIVIK